MKCIVLLCGIPGSGKTSYGKHFAHLCDILSASVRIVHYDDYEENIGNLHMIVLSKLNIVYNILEMWNENSFKLSRQNAISEINNHINNNIEIIIIDDIMFYRSMRKDIYKLARCHSYGFVIVYLQVSLEIALHRNNCRPESSKVPNEVIQYINH
jgi:tRNA uridine 5-carbamoylmethylation protein Kti12